MWSGLEITKLIVQAATPVAVAVLGVYLTRLAKRYELKDQQWARIADMLPGKTSDCLVVNGVLWVHDPEQTSPVRIGHRRRL
jgi:hypothetical protein